jgi:hypothetical protein
MVLKKRLKWLVIDAATLKNRMAIEKKLFRPNSYFFCGLIKTNHRKE